METYDVAVVGLGAVGSAGVAELADRGLAVIGLDTFSSPHDRGSSHGDTRMIREAYYEGEYYVPLVQRALQRWKDLQRRSGRDLFHQTGGIFLGLPDSELVTGSRASAERYSLPYQELTAGEVRERFPVFDPNEDMVGILENRAGFLVPELCIQSYLELATGAGARLRFHETVEAIRPSRDSIRVCTDKGEYRARRLLLAAGPWTAELVPDLKLPLRVERMVQHWFRPHAEEGFGADECPVYAWDPADTTFFYGFPLRPRGLKAAFHKDGDPCDPNRLRRTVSDDEVASMRGALDRFMPQAARESVESAACMYTLTPDQDFVLDRHPNDSRIVIAAGCSGHGFKFASVIGEVIGDLLSDQQPDFDLKPFRLDRF